MSERMISMIRADGAAEQRQLEAMRTRALSKNTDIEQTVKGILETVKEREYSLRFDHAAPYEIAPERLDEAYAACPKELIQALEHGAANIRDYNEKLLSQSMEWTSPDGGCVGRLVRGLTSVGIYVPGGTAAYPS